jgi:hypothetical protein
MNSVDARKRTMMKDDTTTFDGWFVVVVMIEKSVQSLVEKIAETCEVWL